MYVRPRSPLFNAVDAVATAGVSGDPAAVVTDPAAGASPPPAVSAPGASATPADGAPGAAAAQPGSLLARGAGSAPAGQGATAATPADGDAAPTVPEKYRVTNEDGTINWEASALKQAQGYTALAQRLGSGELPPKTPDEYAPELPAGITMDVVKTDPLFAGFLKGAHAHGMNNKQLSYALKEFQQRVAAYDQQRNSPEVAEAELSKVWATPIQMEKGLGHSFRAAKTYASDEAHAAAIEKKFGNDPDFIRLMANVGKELGEDKPVGGLTPAETESLEALKAHPAYSDSRHAEHKVIAAKVQALYTRMYG